MNDPLRDRVVAALGDEYVIEDEVGRGGMSVVYRARDQRLNRTVAIKVLPPELAYDPAIRLRFTREAQTSAHLAHPHIVPIHDVGQREGVAYFVMAFVSGGNLATLLANDPRQPVAEVRRVLCEIADALAYAHLRGVVHRDVKPDNILLDHETGRVMVTDFGIARAIEESTRLTLTGIAVGTPTYMSPEQARGERDVDGRSDIYSLGVVAYQMLTGRVPFTGANSMSLLLKHATERPRPIVELRPDAPPTLREVIERALLKDPEDRWPTAAALRDALRSGEVPVRSQHWEPPQARQLEWKGSDAPPREQRAGILLEPEPLASLTPQQRADIRLWHGRINLMDRVKAFRGYTLVTVGAIAGGFVLTAAGLSEGVPPAILIPIVPIFMTRKWWRRVKSLREAGLRLRRLLLMPRAKWVLPKERRARPAARAQYAAAPPMLEGPYDAAVRRAADDRAAIIEILGSVAKADRALLPDLEPTASALVDRVQRLVRSIHDLDRDIAPGLTHELDVRIGEMERETGSPDRDRRLALLRRQRGTLEQLMERRAELAGQVESACLALGGLRLDLIRLRSSGLDAALSDLSGATQEARSLSHEIGAALEAAADMKRL